MVCKETCKEQQLHPVLFFLRFLTFHRRVRLARCGCICFLTLVLGLQRFFEFILGSSSSSVSQLNVVVSGIFERLLELPSD